MSEVRTTLGLERFRILNRLGEGGEGTVDRALDQLTRQVVSLKQIRSPLNTAEERALLAQEFRLLAGLRHPNIVSVLDFGFLESGSYLAMELHENAGTFLQAGTGRSLKVQIDLIAQLLRGLHHIHSRGILHRDLKPANVLVVGHVVKLVDFGLATRGDHGVGFSGTVRWAAPELLLGGPPSEASDLYSVGLMIASLLSGREQVVDPLSRAPSLQGVPQRFESLLLSMLNPDPEGRIHTAAEVLEQLGAISGDVLTLDTPVSLESSLNTAPIVGRTHLLRRLRDGLDLAESGIGGVLVLEGESGVGKSRLCDELMIEARVRGLAVVRGQAIDRGGDAFRVWRRPVRLLSLLVDVPEPLAALLAVIDPSLTPPSGAVEGASSADLAMAVEKLLVALADRPLLMVLEDLHWASAADLQILRWVAGLAAPRCLIVGTLRPEESGPTQMDLGEAARLPVDRLTLDALRELAEQAVPSLAGTRLETVAKYLHHQSEGLPFFAVETLRELAESAGGVAAVADYSLPATVATPAMERMLGGRLSRLQAQDLELLRVAAIIGRRIDSELMAGVRPDRDFGGWVERCSAAGVLTSRVTDWLFAHDKLREHVVASIAQDERVALHREVATTLADLRPELTSAWDALAYHYQQAGLVRETRRWSQRAAHSALEHGAPETALRHFDVVFGAQEGPDLLPVRASGHDLRATSEAWYQLGNLPRCRDQSEAAVVAMGRPVPGSVVAFAAASLGALLRIGLGALRPGGRKETPEAADLTTVHIFLSEASFYAQEPLGVVWSSVRLVEEALRIGPSAALAEGYMLLGLLAGSTPLFGRLGQSLRARAWRMSCEHSEASHAARMSNRLAVWDLGIGAWDSAQERLDFALEHAGQAARRRLFEESHVMRGGVEFFRGNLEAAGSFYEQGRDLTKQSGDLQVQRWALLGLADVALRQGDLDAALHWYREGEPLLRAGLSSTERVWGYGGLALTLFLRGDEEEALAMAHRAMEECSYMPVGYWTQHGTAACVEVFCRASLVSDRPHPSLKRTLRYLRAYARIFPQGQAPAALWLGMDAAIRGKDGVARKRLRRALQIAQSAGMAWEAARAHVELVALGASVSSAQTFDLAAPFRDAVLRPTQVSTPA